MLCWRVKSVVAFWVLILCNTSVADSPVVAIQPVDSLLKSAVTTPHFSYPVNTTVQQEYIETGVLFVYNEHILDYFGGDTQKIIDFVDDSIEHNNQAFVNSNIPIKRVVAGLLYLVEDEIWSGNDAYTDRLHALAAWQKSQLGQQYKRQYQYSYVVSLAGYAESQDETTMLGQAFVGDSVSWVSPYSTSSDAWLARTLAHELGHNDGFKHSNDGAVDDGAHIARYDAAGYQCGTHGSIMHISGLRIEPFFSDTQISLNEKEATISCGSMGDANSAQVYRDFVNNNIIEAKATFSNLLPTRAKTGVVSIHPNVATVVEGQNIMFDVLFEGADLGDSVNVAVRYKSADISDYKNEILTITHDGRNNVYPVSVPTYADNIVEDMESLTYQLIYPNGIVIDSSYASIEASILDSNITNATSQNTEQASLSNDTDNTVVDNNSVDAAVPSTGNLSVATSKEDSSAGGSLSGMLILLLWMVASARLKIKSV